jgi:hypothetical protein
MYIQSSSRNWKEISFKDVRNEAFGIKIADFDEDDNADIVYGTRNDGIKAWLGNGGGSQGGVDFHWKDGNPGLHDSGGQWQQIEVQDITGDGKPELIAANNGGDKVYLYLNDYPNGWTWIFRGDSDSDIPIIKEDPLTTGGEPYGANFGDWDGNGEVDCAACSWGTGVKAWLIDGNETNQTDENNYPQGGVTPPRIWSYDDYLFSTIFLLVGMGIFGLTAIASRIGLIGARRNRMESVDEVENKDELWYLIKGNKLIIVGIVFLLILQVIGIIFSINYGPDSYLFSFWNPPEILGILLFSFYGFVAFLLFFEIGRTYSKEGISDLEKKTNGENKINKTIALSKISLLLVNMVTYIGILILFGLTINLFYNNSGLDYIILFYIGLMPLAMFLFIYSNNIFPFRTGKQRTALLVTLTTSLLTVFVTVILTISVLALGLDILDVILFYPIILSVFFFVWIVLSSATLKKLHSLV